jgi:hypothetical protein
MLCDPQTWYNTSFGLYVAADALISLYKRDMALVRQGITPGEKPKFYFSMIKPWLLLMAYAIENAAKGIIVYFMVKEDPSLKERATLKDFGIKGHHIDEYLKRAFKAKNEKLGFLEQRLAEDLADYSEFAGKYAIGIDYKNKVRNDLIMKSPSTTYFEVFYLETVVKLYEKIDFWLLADVQEAHPEFKEIRKWSQQFENELR